MSPSHSRQTVHSPHDLVQRWTPARLLDGAPDPYGLWTANAAEPRARLAERSPITRLIEPG